MFMMMAGLETPARQQAKVEKVETVRKIVVKNHRTPIREVAEYVDIGWLMPGDIFGCFMPKPTRIFHHDNMSPHTSLFVRKFLGKTNAVLVSQPPYSPNLLPAPFFFFPKLKRRIKGCS